MDNAEQSSEYAGNEHEEDIGLPGDGKGDLPPEEESDERGFTPGTGWCPFATRRQAHSENFRSGRSSFDVSSVRAVVMHIMGGPIGAATDWFQNPNASVSAHFGIGRDGTILQYVPIADTAFANGLKWINNRWFTPSDNPRPVNPSWSEIIPGVNPNLYTISIEHEGQPSQQWTDAMYTSSLRVLRWIGEQFGQDFRYVPGKSLIGHVDINPLDRPSCPGPNLNLAQVVSDLGMSAGGGTQPQGGTDVQAQGISDRLKLEIALWNASKGGDILGQVQERRGNFKIVRETPLTRFPDGEVIRILPVGEFVPVFGFVDLPSERWFISEFSFGRGITNFFLAEDTQRA